MGRFSFCRAARRELANRRRQATVCRVGFVLLACLTVVWAGGTDLAAEEPRQPDFDYYVLVLGWSPTYCATEAPSEKDPQCDAKRHHFVLHGLWPQYSEGWPRDCWRGRRPWVPDKVIKEMRDIMPNKGLVIHEYRTHGTCSGLDPEQYYGVARHLYERIAVPAGFVGQETQPPRLPPDEIEAEFLQANPWLKPEMISVTCASGALRDVRVCFARDLFPISCGANEEKRTCRAPAVTMSPKRR